MNGNFLDRNLSTEEALDWLVQSGSGFQMIFSAFVPL